MEVTDPTPAFTAIIELVRISTSIGSESKYINSKIETYKANHHDTEWQKTSFEACCCRHSNIHKDIEALKKTIAEKKFMNTFEVALPSLDEKAKEYDDLFALYKVEYQKYVLNYHKELLEKYLPSYPFIQRDDEEEPATATDAATL